jgi:hypothetical protein
MGHMDTNQNRMDRNNNNLDYNNSNIHRIKDHILHIGFLDAFKFLLVFVSFVFVSFVAFVVLCELG